MKNYIVKHSGNVSRLKNFEVEINAENEREATEKVYRDYFNSNYFPVNEGQIGVVKDCDGNVIATEKDSTIDFDGGCFYAEEVNN